MGERTNLSNWLEGKEEGSRLPETAILLAGGSLAMTLAAMSCADWSLLAPVLSQLMGLARYARVCLLIVNLAKRDGKQKAELISLL